MSSRTLMRQQVSLSLGGGPGPIAVTTPGKQQRSPAALPGDAAYFRAPCVSAEEKHLPRRELWTWAGVAVSPRKKRHVCSSCYNGSHKLMKTFTYDIKYLNRNFRQLDKVLMSWLSLFLWYMCSLICTFQSKSHLIQINNNLAYRK